MLLVGAAPQLWVWPNEVCAQGSGPNCGLAMGASQPSRRLGFCGSAVLGGGHLAAKFEKRRGNVIQVCRQLQVQASLMDDPAVWIVRVCVYFALLQTGIAVRPQPTSMDAADKGSLGWLQGLLSGNKEEKEKMELTKLRAKWHASTKGTLVRRYRVPTKAGGLKLLNGISALLQDDDTFREGSTHKGCQIKRENAHAQSVCCHNVRALFDELPTPHLVVEITVFPAGPITTAHYEKADKIEQVLKTGVSI